MRRVATAIWVVSLAVLVVGLLYFASAWLSMLFCAPSNPTYATIMFVDFWGFPILGGAAMIGAQAFLRRDRYAAAIACSMIPWLHLVVYVLLRQVPWECV